MTAAEKRAAYQREYQRANRERLREYGARYRAANSEELARKAAEKRAANPEWAMVKKAKQRAKQKGLDFNITERDVVIPDVCPILGIPLCKGAGQKHDNSPSLDRINSELGYVPGNVAVISERANRLKNNGTSREHRLIADWMDAHVS